MAFLLQARVERAEAGHCMTLFPAFLTQRAVSGRRALAAALLLGAATVKGSEPTWNNFQWGGFVSQGYIVNTGRNDYLGNSSHGTFDFREYAVNGSWSRGKLRVGAQAFGQKLGVYGDDKIKLDWAIADYQATQWFGVRAGRVKMPRGLFNEALDLDAVRPYVLLPQSVYDPRLRDFNASFDGGMAYGNIPAGRAGSFDYRAFGGKVGIDDKSGANDYFNSDRTMTNLAISMKSMVGATLFWNTPVNGLRAGYSYSRFNDLSSLRNSGNTPAGLHTKTARRYPRHLFSTEYAIGNWTLDAEYGREKGRYVGNFINTVRVIDIRSDNTSGYVAVSRRLGRQFEIGAYHDRYDEENGTTTTTKKHQYDSAVSLRYDYNEHLLFKIEAHVYDGAGKVYDTLEHRQLQTNLDQHWSMFAVKTSYVF